MTRPKVEVPANGDIVRWAREIIKMPLSVAAQKLAVSVEVLQEWESGETKPSFPQLLKLCNTYKRSPGFFLLALPPEEPAPPKDFRRLSGGEIAELGPSAHIEIRRALERRDQAIELERLLGQPPLRFEYSARLSDNPEELGRLWRENLQAPPPGKENWPSEFKALKMWKEKVEALGVLVVQAAVDSLEEFRGIAIFNEVFPVIILNSKDSARGKIFSLLHELGHLLLHVSGIGNLNPVETDFSQEARIERFCNAFAGACLVPATDLMQQNFLYLQDGQPDIVSSRTLRQVNGLVRRYQASWEVLIRRLLDGGRISNARYRELRLEFSKHFAALPKKSGGIADIEDKRINANGKRFTTLVLEAAGREVITPSDVSSLLGIKLNHLERLRNKVKGGDFE